MQNLIPKEYKKLSGIYCIENQLDFKKYIGSTTNFQQRFTKHLFELEHGVHPSLHLQSAYNKYGTINFKFYVVRLIDKESEDFFKDLLLTENDLIEEFHSNNKAYGYNLRISAESNFGIIHSDNAKTRIKGKKLSKETRLKMSISRQGINHHSVKLTIDHVKEIKVLIIKGFRNINIARHYGYNKSVINDIKNNNAWNSVKITEIDLQFYKDIEISSKQNQRLNNNQVQFIKFLIRKGIPNYLISHYCKITPSDISSIRMGKTYTHVDIDDANFNELDSSFNIHYFESVKSEYLKVKKENQKKMALRGSKNPTSKLKEADVLRVIDLLENKHKLHEIASIFGVSKDCISKIKNGDNWTHITKLKKIRNGNLVGSQHPNFKYLDNTVNEIIKMTKEGLTTKQICVTLDLEKSFVNRVKSGKTRSNITGINDRR